MKIKPEIGQIALYKTIDKKTLAWTAYAATIAHVSDTRVRLERCSGDTSDTPIHAYKNRDNILMTLPAEMASRWPQIMARLATYLDQLAIAQTQHQIARDRALDELRADQIFFWEDGK
jgi:hypothetical protein